MWKYTQRGKYADLIEPTPPGLGPTMGSPIVMATIGHIPQCYNLVLELLVTYVAYHYSLPTKRTAVVVCTFYIVLMQ